MGVGDVYLRVHVPGWASAPRSENRPCLVGGSPQLEAFSFVASSHLAFFFFFSFFLVPVLSSPIRQVISA